MEQKNYLSDHLKKKLQTCLEEFNQNSYITNVSLYSHLKLYYNII